MANVKNRGDKPEMLTQTNVLGREGWSKKILQDLLGGPDLQKKVSGRSNLASLYLLSRVVAAEATPEFRQAQAALAKRKAASRKAVKTKVDKLMADIEAMVVEVEAIPVGALKRHAIQAYNEWNSMSYATHHSDKDFLERIMVNYIRHNLTDYDYALEETAGRTGKAVAIATIRYKIFSAIAEAYPMFKHECDRQLARKEHDAQARAYMR